MFLNIQSEPHLMRLKAIASYPVTGTWGEEHGQLLIVSCWIFFLNVSQRFRAAQFFAFLVLYLSQPGFDFCFIVLPGAELSLSVCNPRRMYNLSFEESSDVW